MDSFVKRFFPNHDSPGAEIKAEGNMVLSTYYGGVMKVNDGHVTSTRNYYSVQKMTAAGKMEVGMMGAASSLDGLSKQYLTPEGTMNMTALADALKQTAGLQTHVWSAHVNMMQKWAWADNHVALLVNLMRMCFLLRLQEENGNSLHCKLGAYTDGHVSVDMDQWWDSNYPEDAKLDSWPTGSNVDDYPNYQHLTTTTPTMEYNAVDLRGLTVQEATTILMLMGKWKRRSRARVDFDSPCLSEFVFYRHGSKLTGLDSWLKGEAGARQPEMPSSKQVWSALRSYVTQNRLFDQFSATLYIMSFLMYQFLPSTAEGCVWLQMNWKMIYPTFSSIRGRYETLNDGEAALVSHRAINEWGYINGRIEKINLMMLLVAQCFQTGCAVRSNRMGLEVDPTDLFSSQGDFYSAVNFASAAVSEALRAEFPMPGMAGIYLTGGERFDEPCRHLVVTTDAADPDELQGYDVDVESCIVLKKRSARAKLSVYLGSEGYDDLKKRVSCLKEIAAVRLKYEPKASLSEEEEAALADEVLVEEEVEEGDEKVVIKIVWVPFAGVPTLALPLNPFPYSSPFNLKGVIDNSLGELTRRGFKMRADRAWNLANFARLCGYDIDFRSGAEMAGPGVFFSPNDVNMVWPVLAKPDEQDETMTIFETKERQHVFIQLPPLHNKFFSGMSLEYSVQVQRKGVCIWYDTERRDIAEYGGTVRLAKDITVTVNTNETVQRLRGFITREESGFRYVGGVQAGVIPPADMGQPAPPVA